MAEFFAELKRRQMFRVAAAYAVVAWLLLQVVNNLAPGLNLPIWVATSVIVVLAARLSRRADICLDPPARPGRWRDRACQGERTRLGSGRRARHRHRC